MAGRSAPIRSAVPPLPAGDENGALLWNPLCTCGKAPHPSGCTPTGSSVGFDKDASDKKGDSASTKTWIGGGIAIAGALVAGFSIWKLTSKSAGSEHQAARGQRVRKDRTFIVTPVVAPNGGGATMRFDW